jgi:glutamate-5-semialdehyde dehydrogenase
MVMSIVEKAKRAKEAALILANATTADKDRAQIQAANEKDIADALRLTETGKMSKSLLDRLKLNDSKLDELILSVQDVAKLDDPVGKTISAIEWCHRRDI